MFLALPKSNKNEENWDSISPELKPTYQTTDLMLTSFLRCRGFSIENIKQNNGRTLFVFQESPELRRAILDYANDELLRFAPSAAPCAT